MKNTDLIAFQTLANISGKFLEILNFRKIYNPSPTATKQCNLVLAQGQWCTVAVKVTAGPEQSNGLWSRTPAGWQPTLRLGSILSPTLDLSMDYLIGLL